jgi:rod shape-determining protein MreC
VGVVDQVLPDREGDPFLTLRVRPSADLNRLEEVLVITKVEEKQTEPSEMAGKLRASDILAERLPKVTPKPPRPDTVSPSAPKSAPPGTATSPNTPKTTTLTGVAALPGALKPGLPATANGVKPPAKPVAKTPAGTATAPKVIGTPKAPENTSDSGAPANTAPAEAAAPGNEPKEPKTNPAATSGASQPAKQDQPKQEQPPKPDASAPEVPK